MSLKPGMVGAYQPIQDVDDAYIIEIGRFAVTAAGQKAAFVRVVSGGQQVVAGTNYKLIVEVDDHGVRKEYEAVVYDRPWEKVRTLTSFRPVSTPKPGKVGWYQPIPNVDDPYIMEIGQFAVAEHNQQVGQKLVFVRVVSGEQQVVAGMNYHLVVQAEDCGANKEYSALVYDRPWAKVRTLTSFQVIP